MDFLSLLFLTAIIIFLLASLRREYLDSKANLPKPEVMQALESTPEYLVYQGNSLDISAEVIHQILFRHHLYYRQLNFQLKDIFIKRLQFFMQQKTFIIHDTNGLREMPILVSAAATEITFGLKYFSLPWFQYIQIYPNASIPQNSFRLLAGNVEGNSICVAWTYLSEGHQSHADGINVGLPEMAYALYHQFIHSDENKKQRLSNCFVTLMQDGVELFGPVNQADTLFTENTYKNLHEIWGASLALFFEKPVALQQQYPDLFDTLSDLLRQDTTQPEWPVLIVQES